MNTDLLYLLLQNTEYRVCAVKQTRYTEEILLVVICFTEGIFELV